MKAASSWPRFAQYSLPLALLTAFLVIAWSFSALIFPIDIGLDWDNSGYVTQVSEFSEAQVGDLVVTIDGVPVAESTFPYYSWAHDDSVKFELRRGDETVVANATFSNEPRRYNRLVDLSTILVACMFWFVSMLVALRTTSRSHQGICFAYAGTFTVVALAGGVVPYPGWLTHFARICSFWAVAALCHFHVMFPTQLLVIRRKHLVAIYGFPFVATVLVIVWAIQLAGYSVLGIDLRSITSVVANVVVALGLLLIPVLIVLSNRRSGSQDVRRQMGLILASCIFAFTPMLVLSVLPNLIFGEPLVSTALTFIGLSVLVAGYGYAILQRKLLRLDAYISRSASVVMVFGTLTAIYLVITLILGRLLPDDSSFEPLVNLVIVLSMSIVFTPLRQRLQRVSDNLLYGGWYDYSSVVGEVTFRIDEMRNDITELAETFCTTIQRTMRVESVIVLLPSLDSDTFISHEAGNKLSAESLVDLSVAHVVNVLSLLRNRRVPTTTQTIMESVHQDYFTQSEIMLLDPNVPQIWLPLFGRQNSTGLLILGTKLGGAAFDGSDFEILQVVAKQISLALQNYQLIEDLESKASENARFRRELVRAREEERKRLARELHDELIQQLVGVKYQLAGLRADNEMLETVGADGSSENVFERLEEEFVCLIQMTREMCHTLRPPALNLGLIPAIRSTLTRFEKEFDLDIALQIDGDRPDHVDEDVEVCLYRCTSEALYNVWKHASASRVHVELRFSPTNIEWSVRDDGLGFVVPERLGSLMEMNHFGLVNLRERVELVDGRFVISSVDGVGTLLSATIPNQGAVR